MLNSAWAIDAASTRNVLRAWHPATAWALTGRRLDPTRDPIVQEPGQTSRSRQPHSPATPQGPRPLHDRADPRSRA